MIKYINPNGLVSSFNSSAKEHRRPLKLAIQHNSRWHYRRPFPIQQHDSMDKATYRYYSAAELFAWNSYTVAIGNQQCSGTNDTYLRTLFTSLSRLCVARQYHIFACKRFARCDYVNHHGSSDSGSNNSQEGCPRGGTSGESDGP